MNFSRSKIWKKMGSQMVSFRAKSRSLKRIWAKFFFGVRSIVREYILVLLFLTALILGLIFVGRVYWAHPELRNGFWPGVFVEFNGFLLDLLFFGVLLTLVVHIRDKRELIRRYQEEIDDFKKWDSKEAHCRIAGNIRRLARLGKTNVDLRGIILTEFSFPLNDIESIRGSRFYAGEWGNLSSREETRLTNVDFSRVDCSDVVFAPFHPIEFEGFESAPVVELINPQFAFAKLRNAKLNGVSLVWEITPSDSLYEHIENDDGSFGSLQIEWPAFNEADLKGASFNKAKFKNADFRSALNVLDADFTGARGLDTCVFDQGIKEQIMGKYNLA